MISFTGVSVTSDEGVSILHEIDLVIDGPRTAIIGANGSGKTTLARLINGLTAPTRGTVRVDGVDVASERAKVQRRVGFVFANADHQLVYPTPVEDVALGLRPRGVDAATARSQARAQLAAVGLADQADQAIHTLSGGEKHLVALCAVLVLKPHWIVIDEPTTTLDRANRRRVADVLCALPQRLVVISHDLELAGAMDAAVLIEAGRVAATGSPDQVISRYVASIDATGA